jgi:putative SOS response-associated peptidase YedK
MIERISQVFEKADIREVFPDVNMAHKEISRYNISHLKAAYIITDRNPGMLQKHQWGIIPPNSSDGRNKGNLTNARIEQLPSSVSYRIPIRRQRCIVPIDSFYLWEKRNTRNIPYRFFVKDRKILWMAGLWSIWSNSVISKLTFAIISTRTQEDNVVPGNRIPVFLNDELAKLWLEPISLSDVMAIIQKRKDPNLEGYKISEKINSTDYNSSDLHNQELFVPTLFDV